MSMPNPDFVVPLPGQGFGRRRLSFTDQADQMIQEGYQGKTFGPSKRPPLADLAKKFGVSKKTVYARAAELGLATPQQGVPDWDPAEDAILKRYAHTTVKHISDRLRAAGFRRSPGAVGVRRRRFLGNIEDLRLDAGTMVPPQVAECLGVSDRTVRSWIKQGWLKAEQCSYEDDRYCFIVKEKDLRDFIINYTAHVPFDRADKYWLVDVLTGANSGAKRPRRED